MKRHIPNFITCLNLFSGCVAVLLAFKGNYEGAFIAVLLSAVFDFLDGLGARLLKSYSHMGKELDSLADVISFGMAPGAIVFRPYRGCGRCDSCDNHFAGGLCPAGRMPDPCRLVSESPRSSRATSARAANFATISGF